MPGRCADSFDAAITLPAAQSIDAAVAREVFVEDLAQPVDDSATQRCHRRSPESGRAPRTVNRGPAPAASRGHGRGPGWEAS